jgi:hypothetical protein
VDWLVEVNVSEKHAVPIFTAEVMSEAQTEPDRQGNLKQVSEERRVGQTKSAFSGPIG